MGCRESTDAKGLSSSAQTNQKKVDCDTLSCGPSLVASTVTCSCDDYQDGRIRDCLTELSSGEASRDPTPTTLVYNHTGNHHQENTKRSKVTGRFLSPELVGCHVTESSPVVLSTCVEDYAAPSSSIICPHEETLDSNRRQNELSYVAAPPQKAPHDHHMMDISPSPTRVSISQGPIIDDTEILIDERAVVESPLPSSTQDSSVIHHNTSTTCVRQTQRTPNQRSFYYAESQQLLSSPIPLQPQRHTGMLFAHQKKERGGGEVNVCFVGFEDPQRCCTVSNSP